MPIPEGLRTALNEIRETSIVSDTLYHRYIDEIEPTTDIGSWASPILTNPQVMNEFFNVLIQRIVYTQVNVKLYNNPLQILEGDRMPLGSIGQEIAINPIKARKFNVDDFAGLLAKYEADVKVQYMHLNSDLQYCVTVTRAKVVDAFTSWDSLNQFIDGITNSLYNGAYIDHYRMSKDLVSAAYAGNNVQLEIITSPLTSADYAKAFIKKAREIYMNMQFPTSRFNAWNKVGGYGRELLTWARPEDIVILLRTDVAAQVDLEVLASAFNMSKADLIGRIVYVDNFDIYDGDEKVFDGSAIYAFMGDKSWFRIKQREMTMDEFYNANNRTWQFYLNDVRMYAYSLFADGVVFASSLPDVKATGIEFLGESSIVIEEGDEKIVKVALTPPNATSETTFTSATPAVVKVTKISDTEVKVEGVDADATAVTITATNNSHTDTISVKCVAAS